MRLFRKKYKSSALGELILGTANSALAQSLTKTYPGYPDPSFPTDAWLEFAKVFYSLVVHYGIKQNVGNEKVFKDNVKQSIVLKLDQRPELAEARTKINDEWFRDAEETYLSTRLDTRFYEKWGEKLASKVSNAFSLLNDEQVEYFKDEVAAEVQIAALALEEYSYSL